MNKTELDTLTNALQKIIIDNSIGKVINGCPILKDGTGCLYIYNNEMLNCYCIIMVGNLEGTYWDKIYDLKDPDFIDNLCADLLTVREMRIRRQCIFLVK